MSWSSRASQLRHFQEKKDYVNKVKSQPCKICRQVYPPWVMDFDHRDRTTKFRGVAGLLSHNYSLKTVQKEVAKCDVLCANCHRDKTYKENVASGFYSKTMELPKGQ